MTHGLIQAGSIPLPYPISTASIQGCITTTVGCSAKDPVTVIQDSRMSQTVRVLTLALGDRDRGHRLSPK